MDLQYLLINFCLLHNLLVLPMFFGYSEDKSERTVGQTVAFSAPGRADLIATVFCGEFRGNENQHGFRDVGRY